MFGRRTSRCFILQEVLQSHPFSNVTKCRNAGLPMVRIKSIFENRRNGGTRFVAPLYYLK